MIIDKPGHYRLIKPVAMERPFATGTYPAGYEFEVTQIDKEFRKVIGHGLPDWQYWDMPVEPAVSEKN